MGDVEMEPVFNDNFTDNEAMNTSQVSTEPISRKDRLTGSTHFGDTDFFEEAPEQIGDATWAEVCSTCCTHTPREWGFISVGMVLLCFFLYFFLFGLELLGSSAKVIGGCAAGSLFGDDVNPVAGLMIGILATVMLQSSSTTTSIIVGLVGGNTISVRQAIYMVMGANIGTSVTNTIVAMGQMGDGDQLERAFGGATVHDMFNFLATAILFPIEVVTGYLYWLTIVMLPAQAKDGEKWEGPIKKIVSPLGEKVIKANKKVIAQVASGEAADCSEFYPTQCSGGVSYTGCEKVGLISCIKSSNTCPVFFTNGAVQADDEVSGGVCLFLSLVILILCLIGLVSLLQRMLMGTSTRIIYKATNINPYLAILVGVGITILVQSSSITTSALTPLVGLGVLHVEQMFPLTLGANIGTTFTALLASMVSDNLNSLQVALAHFFFNLTGIIIWFPIPFMRRVPINAAKALGKATRIWRLIPIFYILFVFFLFPILLLGLSSLFERKAKGFTALGSMLTIFIFIGIAYFVYWWRFKQGKDKCLKCMTERQRNRAAAQSLPADMEFIKAEILRLKEHTGLPDGIEEDAKGKDDSGDASEETSEE